MFTHAYIVGRTSRYDDPLFFEGDDRIAKLIPLSGLTSTLVRWRSMGRRVQSIKLLTR